MTKMKRLGSRNSAGISLVEMLVAMVVGLFLLAGIIQVYVANLTATTAITGFSSQLENARTAANKLTHSLRFAGHYGGLTGDDVNLVGAVGFTATGGCDSGWTFDTSQAIRGYEGADTVAGIANFPAACIGDDHYISNSDIVSVRYGSPHGWASIDDLDNTKIYLRTSVTGGITGGEILLGSNIASSTVGGGADGVGIYNYEYRTEIYFLRPCSALNGGDCSDGISTLVRMEIDGTSFTTEAIAEGVEQLQIEYGVDSNADFSADLFRTANNVADWGSVVSARFSIVVRSDQADNSYSDNNTYALAGNYDYTPSADDQKFRRKVFTKVIQLRNLSRG